MRKILSIVENNPGIHYSDLVKSTGLAHGVTSHYLSRMERMNLVRIKREKRKAFIFAGKSSDRLDDVLINLRRETAGRILGLLLDRKTATFSEIREAVGKSPSTVSYVLTQLIEVNLVKRLFGITQKYELAYYGSTMQAMGMVRTGRLDAAKDRFSDTFSYL